MSDTSHLNLGKDGSEIEMQNLLDEEDTSKSSLDVEDVLYNGETINLYPLNYQKVPLVRFQILASLLLFMVFGMNDECNGALLPGLTEHYGVTKVQVANTFILQVCGYTLASLLNERVYRRVGAQGAVLIASGMCIVCFTILTMRPGSFYVYLACFVPLGLSIGILDSACNVLFGNLEVHKNECMGILHGVYGAAAMVTPPTVSYFVEFGQWNLVFLFPLGLSLAGFVLAAFAFKTETANKYNYICSISKSDGDEEHPSFFTLLKKPAIFLYAMFLFVYLGSEVSTGAWILTYLMEVKHGSYVPMSYVTAAFWLGLTVGRLVLGFVTRRSFRNEYRASRFYAGMTGVFYTLFLLLSLIDSQSTFYFVVIAIVVFFAGVFIGPLFPNASVVALQVLPKNLHVSGVGIAVALGGCGAAALPYAIGLVTSALGFGVFPLLCWCMVALVNIMWFMYPKLIKGHDEYL
ncbi:LAMI_0G06766g1_1 [Lachancea mirantina]|uniref:LAMI_0G06766g1_1 n=1 Tax=Lachancea mirantina TaxID=1230905 RepID=A0A1G4K9C9_9SACH|nr:LAMI_0G06766g1_1 [Lachancea mirantina]